MIAHQTAGSGFGDLVALSQVEHELTRRRQAVQQLHCESEAPVIRACMSNLVIYTDSPTLGADVSAQVPTIVALHPARVLLLIAEPAAPTPELLAFVGVRGRLIDPGRWVVTEQITLRARGTAVERLPFAVRSLVIGDLPTNLWWATHQPPPMGGSLTYELAEHAQQVIYDSNGWRDPPRDMAATAGWLTTIDRVDNSLAWRVASDLNWRRLKYWRRLLSQALDPSAAEGALTSITELVVDHGPHAVIQAWELVSWLASRLNWRVRGSAVEPGVELTWHCDTGHGGVRVCIRRRPDGPSEVQRLRIACTLDGQPSSLTIFVEDGRRLALQPEGATVATRTITARPQPLAELLARQLSDREDDPVFGEAMGVAQVFAQSLLAQR